MIMPAAALSTRERQMLTFAVQGMSAKDIARTLLITPRTVGTAADAARVTERMRGLTPALEPSIRQGPRRPPPAVPAPTAPESR